MPTLRIGQRGFVCITRRVNWYRVDRSLPVKCEVVYSSANGGRITVKLLETARTPPGMDGVWFRGDPYRCNARDFMPENPVVIQGDLR